MNAVTCACTNLGIGRSAMNEYTCSDGSSAHCRRPQEACLSTSFPKGSFTETSVCDVTCRCSNPGQAGGGINGYFCSDGSSGFCPSPSIACIRYGSFPIAEAATSICGVPAVPALPALPTCWCTYPGDASEGHNGFECSDGSLSFCTSADLACLPASPFPKANSTETFVCGATCTCSDPGVAPSYACSDFTKGACPSAACVPVSSFPKPQGAHPGSFVCGASGR